jgi:hypothetical protein
MSDWSAHVLPHGPLTQLAPRMWQVTGTMKNVPLPRNMTIWRMADGGLWIHSAVACDDATMAEIEALGRPSVLVVPNGFHRLDAGVWKDRYPGMRVVCPEGSRAKVGEVLKVDGLDSEVPGVITHGAGLKASENIYEVDAGAGNGLVVCDALFNVAHIPGFMGFVLKMIGSTGGFKMTNIARFAVLEDKKAFAQWMEQAAASPDLALLCLSHGDAVLADAARKLKDAAAAL